MSNNIINTAKRTILSESQSIAELENFINQDFENAVTKIYQSKGRLIISGIGKSAIVAQKIVSSLNSTGTPSIFLHAADAIHGDIGMVQQEDIVIIISKSGDSPEIKVLVPLIKNFKNTHIAPNSLIIICCFSATVFTASSLTNKTNCTASFSLGLGLKD